MVTQEGVYIRYIYVYSVYIRIFIYRRDFCGHTHYYSDLHTIKLHIHRHSMYHKLNPHITVSSSIPIPIPIPSSVYSITYVMRACGTAEHCGGGDAGDAGGHECHIVQFVTSHNSKYTPHESHMPLPRTSASRELYSPPSAPDRY